MQTDPVGYKDQMNMYAYVGNDPVNARDPTGKFIFLLAAPALADAAIYAGVAITGIIVGAFVAEEIIVPAITSNDGGTTNNEPTVSGREPGPDGKTGSTGGPGEGKRFNPEKPSVKETKEGVPCRYCGAATTNKPGQPNSRERDHIDPKSRGGNNSPENEGDSCRTCNREKGAKNPDEYIPKPKNNN